MVEPSVGAGAIARPADAGKAGQSGDATVRIDPAQRMVGRIRDVDPTVPINRHARRLMKAGRAAHAIRIACLSLPASHRQYLPVGHHPTHRVGHGVHHDHVAG